MGNGWFLFFDSKEELVEFLPDKRPTCSTPSADPYQHISDIGKNELEDPYHFGLSLIEKINSTPFQEIGTHTFAHYTRWDSQEDEEFLLSDLLAAKKSAERLGLNLLSLVFPRNHYNETSLSACKRAGIKSFRGNLGLYDWEPLKKLDVNHILNRGKRFLDSFFSISNHQTFNLKMVVESDPCNIPCSRFLRPYSRKLRFLEPFKIRRMMSDMTHAAKNGLVYHIYFHPHNFGVNLEKNMEMFESIIGHFKVLEKKYGMKSANMNEVAELAEAYILNETCNPS